MSPVSRKLFSCVSAFFKGLESSEEDVLDVLESVDDVLESEEDESLLFEEKRESS